jgi:acetyl-CoA acetyltransferase
VTTAARRATQIDEGSTVTDRVAIVGVGYSTVARDTGLSYKELTIQSATAAMADAGMGPGDIDGVVLHAFGQPEPWGEEASSAVNDKLAAQMLGLTPINWYSTSGTNFGDMSNGAIAAVRAGYCHTCIVIHPCRTAPRKPAPGAPRPRPPLMAGDMQFAAPYGPPAGPGIIAGLTMQRHMAQYGTTAEQVGAQQITSRYHASLNEEALFRTPLTIEEYLDSRWITRPVRLLDCDYPCDAGSAVIITTEERASSWRKKPVFVEASAMASTETTWEYLPDILEGATKHCADMLWSRTHLRPSDVDCVQLYDGFSIMPLNWLEALGFVEPGESGPFIEDGNTRIGGALPVNTDGGVCNVGRRHGASHCIEAVRQLRGECGERQVPAEASLYTVAHGPNCHAVLLTSS